MGAGGGGEGHGRCLRTHVHCYSTFEARWLGKPNDCAPRPIIQAPRHLQPARPIQHGDCDSRLLTVLPNSHHHCPQAVAHLQRCGSGQRGGVLPPRPRPDNKTGATYETEAEHKDNPIPRGASLCAEQTSRTSEIQYYRCHRLPVQHETAAAVREATRHPATVAACRTVLNLAVP